LELAYLVHAVLGVFLRQDILPPQAQIAARSNYPVRLVDNARRGQLLHRGDQLLHRRQDRRMNCNRTGWQCRCEDAFLTLRREFPNPSYGASTAPKLIDAVSHDAAVLKHKEANDAKSFTF
jgi:hypothetical protein